MTLKRLSTERILRKIIIGLIGLSVSYWDGLVQDQLIIETLSIMGFLYGLVPQWHGLIQEGPLLGLLHNKLGRSDYAGELLKFLIILLWDLFILLQIFCETVAYVWPLSSLTHNFKVAILMLELHILDFEKCILSLEFDKLIPLK